MNNKEKCFVFYERWYTQLQRLPPEEKLKMYEAICKYAFGLETEEMAYYLESLMDNIRTSIDNDKDKQNKFLELQKEKSRKAVEAKKRYREFMMQKISGNPTQPTDNKNQSTDNQEQSTDNPDRKSVV